MEIRPSQWFDTGNGKFIDVVSIRLVRVWGTIYHSIVGSVLLLSRQSSLGGIAATSSTLAATLTIPDKLTHMIKFLTLSIYKENKISFQSKPQKYFSKIFIQIPSYQYKITKFVIWTPSLMVFLYHDLQITKAFPSCDPKSKSRMWWWTW